LRLITSNINLHAYPLTAGALLAFLITPIILPVILIAISTFYAYGRVGLNNTITGLVLVLAHTALEAPIEACKNGHDHDANPVDFTPEYLNVSFSIGFAPRNREINRNSGFSVIG
jgi:hypothetical protein